MSNASLPTIEATALPAASWPAPAGVPVVAPVTVEMPVTEIAMVAASATRAAVAVADDVSALDPAWESRFCKMVDTLYVPKSLQRRQLQLAAS